MESTPGATHRLTLDGVPITQGAELAIRLLFNHLAGISFKRRRHTPVGFESVGDYRRHMADVLGVGAWKGVLAIERISDAREICRYRFEGPGPAGSARSIGLAQAA